MNLEEYKIPKYLHYKKGRRVYQERHFKPSHLLYRTGFKEENNPIEFPSTLTSISVCWSLIILQKDVLYTVLKGGNPERLGNHVYYGKVEEIKEYCNECNCDEGLFKGIHKIRVKLRHSPIELNYSHCEILIEHSFFENAVLKTIIIEHKDWKESLLMKGVPKAFFKKINLDYRASMAILLNSDCDEVKIPFYFKIIPKKLLLKIFLYLKISWHRFD